MQGLALLYLCIIVEVGACRSHTHIHTRASHRDQYLTAASDVAGPTSTYFTFSAASRVQGWHSLREPPTNHYRPPSFPALLDDVSSLARTLK